MNIRACIATTLSLMLGFGAAPALADHEYGNGRSDALYDYARVIRAEPIIRYATVRTPVEECWTETEYYSVAHRPRGTAGGAIVGAIIGGVIGSAPSGAKGQELRSLDVHGAPDLSRPSTAYHPKFGKIFGGAIGLLQFTAGDKPGLYRPTLVLLSDPSDQTSPNGSSYTYTIVVK